jgi:hypothetical protein
MEVSKIFVYCCRYHPRQLLQRWPWWWNAVGSGWVFFCYSFWEEREGAIEKRECTV